MRPTPEVNTDTNDRGRQISEVPETSIRYKRDRYQRQTSDTETREADT